MQLERTADIWRTAAQADLSHAQQLTTRAQHANGFGGLAWTPDGRIVYASIASGNPDLWLMRADGTEQKQLTADPQQDYQPSVSADGRFIVFASKRTGNWNIWRMDIDGGNLQRLTSGNDDEDPALSPDGQWVVYDSYEAGVSSVWKVAAAGGAPVRLTDAASAFPHVSPDGQLVAYLEINKQGTRHQRFVLVPLAGGGPVKTIELRRMLPTNSDSLAWAADGRALLYVDTSTSGGVGNLWLQPLDGRPPSPLTQLTANGIYFFAQSRDGKQLALARGTITKDAVLISEER
jgi:TolB protein